MPYFTYILLSPTGRTYVGQTENATRRLSQHNSGLCKTTSREQEWRILHLEQFATRREAIVRERWFKTGVGREFISRLKESDAESGS